MSLFKQRADYFKSLAKKNKLLAHEIEAAGEKRCSFFRMNDEEELNDAAPNFIHFPCLVHFGFAGRYTTAVGNVPKRRLVNGILFLHNATATDMESIEYAYDTAFEAMEQVISAMYKEFTEQGYCGNFYDLDLSRFSFTPVGPIASGLYGWSLSFEDNQSAQGITNYDASKWFE